MAYLFITNVYMTLLKITLSGSLLYYKHHNVRIFSKNDIFVWY